MPREDEASELKWRLYPYAFEVPIGGVITVTDDDFEKAGGRLPPYGEWLTMTAYGEPEGKGHARYRREK